MTTPQTGSQTAPQTGPDTPRTILVTGGAGFIGSHTCLTLLEHGNDVVVVDDFSNSSPLALERVAKLAGRPVSAVHEADLRDPAALGPVFAEHRIDSVIHFAAKKAVGESFTIPLEYYSINVAATANVLTAMRDAGVHDLVFSSSCSVYGAGGTDGAPLTEDRPFAPTNPYARTKVICEQLIADACARYPEFRVISLRYFNPVGAHESGLLGEDPRGVPNNVMPFITQVAVGRRDELTVFGDDYDTVDGTGVRDYIHVVDLADGHRVALDHLADAAGMQVFNLGTGSGTSVLQLVAAFEEASGATIPVRIAPRRPGDVDTLIAGPGKVEAAWGWRTTRDLRRMVADAWAFQKLNPGGYEG